MSGYIPGKNSARLYQYPNIVGDEVAIVALIEDGISFIFTRDDATCNN